MKLHLTVNSLCSHLPGRLPSSVVSVRQPSHGTYQLSGGLWLLCNPSIPDKSPPAALLAFPRPRSFAQAPSASSLDSANSTHMPTPCLRIFLLAFQIKESFLPQTRAHPQHCLSPRPIPDSVSHGCVTGSCQAFPLGLFPSFKARVELR